MSHLEQLARVVHVDAQHEVAPVGQPHDARCGEETLAGGCGQRGPLVQPHADVVEREGSAGAHALEVVAVDALCQRPAHDAYEVDGQVERSDDHGAAALGAHGEAECHGARDHEVGQQNVGRPQDVVD